MQLGQLDLEPPLVGLGPAGEDIEDQGRPVDHLDVEGLFQVPLLGGGQLGIDQHHVVAETLSQGLDLPQLALAEVRARHRVRQPLGHRPNDLDIDGLGQPGQFLQGVGCLPDLVPRLDIDRDQQGLLRRPGGRERPLRPGNVEFAVVVPIAVVVPEAVLVEVLVALVVPVVLATGLATVPGVIADAHRTLGPECRDRRFRTRGGDVRQSRRLIVSLSCTRGHRSFAGTR